MKHNILLLLCLLLTSLPCFSQEKTISLYADKDYESSVTLMTKEGNATGINLSFVLNWDKNRDIIQIEFKNIQAERTAYLFTGMMFFKDASKIKKEIWFSKELSKKVLPKNTVRSISNNWLSNAIIDDSEVSKAKIYDLQNPGVILKFKVRNPSEPCAITINLYTAVNEKKSKATKKIDAICELTLNISLLDLCLSPELTSAITTYQSKIDNMKSQITMIKAEMDNFVNVSCRTIKEFYGKPTVKEEKIYALKEQYQHYNECNNLKEVISEYNTTIDAFELATLDFNSKLEDRQRKCQEIIAPPVQEVVEEVPPPVVAPPPVVTQPVVTQPVSQPVNCQVMRQANERLAELLLDIKNSKISDLTSFKLVFEKIKQSVSEPGYKNCKENKAYEDLCKRIDNRLK